MNVELLDHHGSDLLVVRAARVSFAKDTDWESEGYTDENDCWVEEQVLSERDVKLINFLAREKHVLPFRHPQITLRCKAPIFLARQLGKHQVGMSWSEESRRYIDSEPEFFWPDKWRKRAENVKQGSSDEEVENAEMWMAAAQEHKNNLVAFYNAAIAADMAPELARMILPQNMYINWAWTGSLLSFFEMYKLRSEGHAQVEAQQFAQLVKDVVSKLYPVSWSALEEHQ